jgi:hypothetical protein
MFNVTGLRPGDHVLYVAYAGAGLFLPKSATGTQVVYRREGEARCGCEETLKVELEQRENPRHRRDFHYTATCKEPPAMYHSGPVLNSLVWNWPEAQIELDGHIADEDDYYFVMSSPSSTYLRSSINVKFTPRKAGVWTWKVISCVNAINSLTSLPVSGGQSIVSTVISDEEQAKDFEWKIVRDKDLGYALADPINPKKATLAGLAKQIRLEPSEAANWFNAAKSGDGTRRGKLKFELLDGDIKRPISELIAAGRFGDQFKEKKAAGFWFMVPNTIVAYWGGELGGAGAFLVAWGKNIDDMKAFGFFVQQYGLRGPLADPLKDTKLRDKLVDLTEQKLLYGVYFWGHGVKYVEKKDRKMPQKNRDGTDMFGFCTNGKLGNATGWIVQIFVDRNEYTCPWEYLLEVRQTVGSGAKATANVTGQKVSSVDVTDKGNGYIEPPLVRGCFTTVQLR